MTLQFPPMFSERLNRLDDTLSKYEAHPSDDQQAQYLREALVTSCEILRSVDLDDLHDEFQAIYEKAAAEEPKWRNIYLEDDGKFEYFLHTLENQILEHIGLNNTTRERMRNYVHDARYLAPGMSPAKITSALKFLKDDICMEARVERLTAQYLKRKRRKDCIGQQLRKLLRHWRLGWSWQTGCHLSCPLGYLPRWLPRRGRLEAPRNFYSILAP
jgi:hypothetical protein